MKTLRNILATAGLAGAALTATPSLAQAQGANCTVRPDAAMYIDAVRANGSKIMSPKAMTDPDGDGIRTAGVSFPDNWNVYVVPSGTHQVQFHPANAAADKYLTNHTINGNQVQSVSVADMKRDGVYRLVFDTKNRVGCTDGNGRFVINLTKPGTPVQIYNAAQADSVIRSELATERSQRIAGDIANDVQINGLENRFISDSANGANTDAQQDERISALERGTGKTPEKPYVPPRALPPAPQPPRETRVHTPSKTPYFLAAGPQVTMQSESVDAGVGSVAGDESSTGLGGMALFGVTPSKHFQLGGELVYSRVNGKTSADNPRLGGEFVQKYSGSDARAAIFANTYTGLLTFGADLAFRATSTEGEAVEGVPAWSAKANRTSAGVNVGFGSPKAAVRFGMRKQISGDATPGSDDTNIFYGQAGITGLTAGTGPVDATLRYIVEKGTAGVDYERTSLEGTLAGRLAQTGGASIIGYLRGALDSNNFGQESNSSSVSVGILIGPGSYRK
jgi:hypothetical protein